MTKPLLNVIRSLAMAACGLVAMIGCTGSKSAPPPSAASTGGDSGQADGAAKDIAETAASVTQADNLDSSTAIPSAENEDTDAQKAGRASGTGKDATSVQLSRSGGQTTVTANAATANAATANAFTANSADTKAADTVPGNALPENVDDLFRDAASEAEHLLRLHPNSPDSHELAARVYWICGRFDQAGEIWQRAVTLNPNYAYAHHGLGQVAGKKGDFEQAAKHHLKAVELLPGYHDAVLYAAGALTQVGETQQAAELLQRLAEKANAPTAWLRLAQAYVASRDYPKAVEAFARVQDLTPDNIDALTGYALALARTGATDKAREMQQRLREIRKETRVATRENRKQQDDFRRHAREISAKLLLFGRLYMAARQLDDAERTLVRSAALDPNSEEARVQLAGYYMGVMQAEPAAQACQELVALDPENAQYRSNYGMMLMRLQKPGEAVMQLEKAAELNRSPQFLAMLAEAHAANLDIPAAIIAIDEAIRMDPDNGSWKAIRSKWE